jgi:protein sidekick
MKNLLIEVLELQPLQQIEWYGVPRGYNVSYRQVGVDSPLDSVSIEDHNANSFVLEGLEEFALYQVLVQAYNDVGTSLPSPPAQERTRESSKLAEICVPGKPLT